MRVSTKRSWIKLYINNYINGSVRYQLTPAERGVWVDLLCLAGLSSTPGTICDSDNRAYPHNFISNRFNIRTALLDETLNKCITEGRITEDEKGIHIVNWSNYQSEYQRQKPYRDSKEYTEI